MFELQMIAAYIRFMNYSNISNKTYIKLKSHHRVVSTMSPSNYELEWHFVWLIFRAIIYIF